MKNGLISQTLNWISHPAESNGTPGEWLAGLLVVLILSFLWTQVLSQIE